MRFLNINLHLYYSYKSWICCLCSALSHVQPFVTPWTVALQASLSLTISQSLLKLMSIESVMPSNHPILCRPLLLPPSIFPSFRVFSNESALQIRWPKYWSFSFSISPPSEYSGFISFSIDWFDLLAVQGILKSLLQHHSWKALILWCSAFFMVQLPCNECYYMSGAFLLYIIWWIQGIRLMHTSLTTLTLQVRYCFPVL